MVDPLSFILLKLQSVFGTPETTLDEATDYFPAIKGSSIEAVPEFNKIEEMAGEYDQMADSRGMVNLSGEINCNMRSLGADTAPDFAILAKAGGMTETISYYDITLTLGADKSATWEEDDELQNDSGNGDDWTGTLVSITATQVVVALTTGTFAAIATADGIENTTKSDTTTVSAKSSSNKYSYSPAIAARGGDLTAWHFTGGIGDDESVLSKFGNIVGNWKITIEAGKVSVFSLNGLKGKYISEEAETIVSPTKKRVLYPSALAWTVSVNGIVYKLIKLEIDGGNEPEQQIDGTEENGYGRSEIGNKKGTFTAQFYADASLELPSVEILAGTIGDAITVEYGPTDREIYVSIGYPQFQKWEKATVGNLTVFNVSGIMERNNFAVAANNGLT